VQLSDLWFQHKSPHKLESLEPQFYGTIVHDRTETMEDADALTYILSRIRTEDSYHSLVKSDDNKSFIYATIVGFNKMESPDDYPGFTYYFKLTRNQLKNTIFEVVAGADATLDVFAGVGHEALSECLKRWVSSSSEMERIWDEVLGADIEPRIEVIIPYPVTPLAYYPEEEER